MPCIETNSGSRYQLTPSTWEDPDFLVSTLMMDLTDYNRSHVLAALDQTRKDQDDYPDISA
ncbi:MAG: hypothetical protein JRJ37_10450 [Deltaproteobacteria bacterium]|nr:hypothetical protein [Deltaproteobacteria bacterium]MBW2369672.1 hypothetical protein [Deltaproteobacteria bacterium]